MAEAHRTDRDARGDDGFRDCGFFAFRVPALPLSTLTSWSDGVKAPDASPPSLQAALDHDRALLRGRLQELATLAEVRAALAVASPDLCAALVERGDDPGVEAAFIRYVSRMASRATPYGLFAACGTGRIGGTGGQIDVVLPPFGSWHRNSRVDADYLDAVVRDRAVALRRRLDVQCNDSLHLMAGRWRYVRSTLDGQERDYQLVQVPDTSALQRALEAAGRGAPFASVADAVAAGGATPERAVAYVERLLEAQVLVPVLAVTITGPLPLDALIEDLQAVGDTATVEVLRDVRSALKEADGADLGSVPAHCDRVARRLTALGLPIDRSRLLQVDLTVAPVRATLAQTTADEIARAVDVLARVAPRARQTELDHFREAFVERYDRAEVPLLEALDEELGVGFGPRWLHSDPSPLVGGLPAPEPEAEPVQLGRRERHLMALLHRAWSEHSTEVALTAADLEALAEDDPRPLPTAVSASAVVVRTAEGPRVLVTDVAGPSGARLLGRFCHDDPEIDGNVRSHLETEEALDPDAVYAEVVHLPSGRLVNVLARPVLRRYELEWLGRSGAPADRRLSAADLLVSVRDGRFVLRSRSLGRRVVPRLTSAHNYSRRSPGVYRFLAAVQSDGVREHLQWSWSPFESAPFLPRVRWGQLVLARARWRISSAELGPLDQRDDVMRWKALQHLRQQKRLPRWVCLAEGDNVLAFDLDNVLSTDTFVRAVRRHDAVLLEELYPRPGEVVADGPDGARAIELVVPLVRAGVAPSPPPPTAPAGRVADIRRTFPPGTEWGYLKLYTGSATADRLLCEAIAPAARRLVDSGAADAWFFIRYSDPAFHLRVRIHGDHGLIVPALEELGQRSLDEGLAHDVVLATYRREVERYGGSDGIVVAERLFHADSDAAVDILSLLKPGAPEAADARWRLGLLGCEFLMRDLGLDDEARLAQSTRMRESFAREFRAGSPLRSAVAQKVRAERAAVEALLDADAYGEHPLAPGVAVLARRSQRIAALAAELRSLEELGRIPSVESLSGSFVHMWLDRLCRSDNRLHEYVIYAMLAASLRSRVERRRTAG